MCAQALPPAGNSRGEACVVGAAGSLRKRSMLSCVALQLRVQVLGECCAECGMAGALGFGCVHSEWPGLLRGVYCCCRSPALGLAVQAKILQGVYCGSSSAKYDEIRGGKLWTSTC